MTLAADPHSEGFEALAMQSWRGKLILHGRSEAPGLRYLRQAAAVWVREFGF